MCVVSLSYAELGTRLNISREAARSLARRRRLPRSQSDQGEPLVSVDLAELRYTPRLRTGREDGRAASVAKIEAAEIEASEIEALKAKITRLEAIAAGTRVNFERARERADRLAVELRQAMAETTAAHAWAARLEDEVAALRTDRAAGGSIAGQAALRLGKLAASIVGADRAARR